MSRQFGRVVFGFVDGVMTIKTRKSAFGAAPGGAFTPKKRDYEKRQLATSGGAGESTPLAVSFGLGRPARICITKEGNRQSEGVKKGSAAAGGAEGIEVASPDPQGGPEEPTRV